MAKATLPYLGAHAIGSCSPYSTSKVPTCRDHYARSPPTGQFRSQHFCADDPGNRTGSDIIRTFRTRPFEARSHPLARVEQLKDRADSRRRLVRRSAGGRRLPSLTRVMTAGTARELGVTKRWGVAGENIGSSSRFPGRLRAAESLSRVIATFDCFSKGPR